jgi:dTDP-4-amino-4,6-dideoxygalactose transaminase
METVQLKDASEASMVTDTTLAEAPAAAPISAPIPFSVPWIGEEEIAAVVECLRSGWITTGPRVKQFEAAFAEYLGCRHAVALNSCTAALHLALEALGVGPGDEVLVPTMTFAATAEVVRHLGARPILCDCRPDTLNLDVQRVAAYLEEHAELTPEGCRHRLTGARLRAVIPVHFAGLPCAMRPLLALAERYRLAVLEDAAHALPAAVEGRPVGCLADAAAFSFYATKNITTGEGGMLTTNDDALADRARIMSLHGISRDAWLRYTARGSWDYQILASGYKYNMTDIAAALGLQQLRRSEEFCQVRRHYAAQYTEALGALPELQTPPDAPPGDRHAWHLYVLRLRRERLTIDRTAFIEALRVRGIGASVHFIPLHLHPYYRQTYGYTPADLPVASAVSEQIVSLPLYPRMRPTDLQRVIAAIMEIVARHRA